MNDIGDSNDNADSGFNTDEQESQEKDDGVSSEGDKNLMDGFTEILNKQKQNKCKDYLFFPAELDTNPKLGKALFQCLTWMILSSVSLGFLGYHMFLDPDKVGDTSCRATDSGKGRGTNIGLRFAFLMSFFMATSLVFLLSRIFALAAIIQAICDKSSKREPANKSSLGKCSCYMLSTSIVCGCFFYYVYGNRIIFGDAAMVCMGRSEDGVDPYPDSKLLVKTGTFLQRYSLAV